MKIAILSFSFLTPDHIARLKKLGEVFEYQTTKTEEDAIERLKDVEIAVADCWDVPLNKKVLGSIPSVKYISLNSTGFNQVDIEAATENNVAIANVPGFSTEAVAEQTFALMFAVARKITMSNAQMTKEPIQVDPANRAHDIFLGTELRGKTLGIVGLGQIGSRVAEIAKAFGMRVISYNRTPKQIDGVEVVDFDTLLKNSDIVSINSAYVSEMKNMFDQDTFAKMKDGSILVNTARGEFVDEQALVNALKSGKVKGFGADVVVGWNKSNPLIGLDSVVLSPHSAFFTNESVKNMADIIVENVESYINGKPNNVINS